MMDLRGSLFFHLHKGMRALHQLASTLCSRFIASCKGVRLGSGFRAVGIPYFYRTPHSSITIGSNCTLLSSFKSNNIGSMIRSRICTMTPQASISIGNNVGLSAVTITAHDAITIGDETQIGAGTVIVDADFHDLSSSDPQIRHNCLGKVKPVNIGRNVFIGTRCIILKGVTIGDNAVIGAGAIVRDDIPANTKAAGNPARAIAPMTKDAAI